MDTNDKNNEKNSDIKQEIKTDELSPSIPDTNSEISQTPKSNPSSNIESSQSQTTAQKKNNNKRTIRPGLPKDSLKNILYNKSNTLNYSLQNSSLKESSGLPYANWNFTNKVPVSPALQINERDKLMYQSPPTPIASLNFGNSTTSNQSAISIPRIIPKRIFPSNTNTNQTHSTFSKESFSKGTSPKIENHQDPSNQIRQPRKYIKSGKYVSSNSTPSSTQNVSSKLAPKSTTLPKAAKSKEEIQHNKEIVDRFLLAIEKDKLFLSNPSYKHKFSSYYDALERLLPYHIYQYDDKALKSEPNSNDLYKKVERISSRINSLNEKILKVIKKSSEEELGQRTLNSLLNKLLLTSSLPNSFFNK